jgi:hypothetical protein
MNTTAVCCVSAAGFYVPPMLIYKRERACEEFKDGAPAGTVFVFNPEQLHQQKHIRTANKTFYRICTTNCESEDSSPF